MAESDSGYVLGRCRTCGEQGLLDLGALVRAGRSEVERAPVA